MQVLDARLGDVYTGGDGGSSPAGGAADATVAPPGAALEGSSHGQRASFDSDAAVQVRSYVQRTALICAAAPALHAAVLPLPWVAIKLLK